MGMMIASRADRAVRGAQCLLGSHGISAAVLHKRLLVVGAGGIGCELLKNLALTGFTDVTVVDLDTIETSNLNRQLLFTAADVGAFKADVAARAVAAMAPQCRVEPVVGNVMDCRRFGVAWFRRFDIVLSALDNLEARRHVNMMAVVCGRPVVESGTAGWVGQCTVGPVPLAAGATECFACQEHPVPTVFPVCTIRATPSKMVHCIEWAKSWLLAGMFGTAGQECLEGVPEAVRDGLAGPSFANLPRTDPGECCRLLFQRLFVDDINRLLRVKDLFEARPVPLAMDTCGHAGVAYHDDPGLREYSLAEWASVFSQSMARLLARPTPVPFDKDDGDVMAFVAAAANLRAHVFGIPMTSLFKAKEVAGNIVPAVATTNAIAAALVAIQAVNCLAGCTERLCTVYITHGGGRRVFGMERLQPASRQCPVCSAGRLLCPVALSIAQVLQHLRLHTDVSVLVGHRLIYDSEDMAAHHATPLRELQLHDGHVLTIVGRDATWLVGLKEEGEIEHVSLPAAHAEHTECADCPGCRKRPPHAEASPGRPARPRTDHRQSDGQVAGDSAGGSAVLERCRDEACD